MRRKPHKPPKHLKRIPRTEAESIELYDYLYRQQEYHLGNKGSLKPYGSHADRDDWFLEWLGKKLPRGSKVLDASCGRGHLVKSLTEAGYQTEATEISSYLISGPLRGLGVPVYLLPYSKLSDLGENKYDCVCSNDVLEHMLSEEAIDLAIRNMILISRNLIALSIGLSGNKNKYTEALRIIADGKPVDLHTQRHDKPWWLHKLRQHGLRIIEPSVTPWEKGSLSALCKIPRQDA